ncbi:ubiquitin carboxyl-terminal hydrolase 30-like [Uloborus diversus]|uniref:ubiquitin carboxyl-terminal hydrolase 30-like n=1 Tax=Uloborus diversus TaxID=327109 RepID=UPI00240A0FA2|nr:ubiquitin carboxyl-terminal hydrolase 30-like [Uloborus diversus]
MMSSLNFWFCAGAAALVLAGTYIFWGPSNRPKRRKKGYIPGMINLGNSCFLNAVLQALASCTPCIVWLEEILSSASETMAENLLLIKSLASILNRLNNSEEICNAAQVIEALRSHRWIITNEEQDAHELFHVLTTTIEEELMARKPVLSLLDAGKLENTQKEENSSRSEKSFVSKQSSSSKVASPLAGLLVSELKCNSCNSKYPTRCDSFDSISLGIPSSHYGQITLQDLLLKFISCELVQDVACDFCSKQNENSPEPASEFKSVFSKQLSFGKLPKCLCIHIPRTAWLRNGLSVKCYDYVAFPEILIMDHFVHCHMMKNKHLGANYTRLRLTGGSTVKRTFQDGIDFNSTTWDRITKFSEAVDSSMNESSSIVSERDEYLSSYNYVYLLKAVIVHLGDTTSGHFITYRRGPAKSSNESTWFCVSDSEVKEVSLSDVFRSCAYMLFYEKIK